VGAVRLYATLKSAGQTSSAPRYAKTAEDGRCKNDHDQVWKVSLVEQSNSTGATWKEGTWTKHAQCDGGVGTLTYTRVQFSKTQGGPPDSSGNPTLEFNMSVKITVTQASVLKQPFQVYDANGTPLFALGPFQYEMSKAGEYRFDPLSSGYANDTYDKLAACCRLPSGCV
jgi:hypothetical protein